jgi:hypothetical protein
MTTGRWIRVLWAKVLIIAAAAYIAWLGIRILTGSLPNNPTWLGWFCVVGGALKAAFWTFVTIGLIRHPKAVMAAKHWE